MPPRASLWCKIFPATSSGLPTSSAPCLPCTASSQRLSKHLDGSLRPRVGHKPGRRDALTYGRSDRDDATATLHVFQRRLRRDEYPADVDVDHAIHLFQGRLLERFRNGRAGTVHQNIQLAEGRDGLFDRGLDGVRIGGICLNRNRLSAAAFNLLHDRGGRISALGVSERHACPVGCQPLGNRCANSSRTASDYRDLARQFLSIVIVQVFCSFFCSSLFSWALDSRLSSEADVVIEFNSVEPCLDVFASLAVLPDIFGKPDESLTIAVGTSPFHVSGPGFDLPRRSRDLGMSLDPFEDLLVAFSFSQFLQESFGIEAEKPDQVLVRAGIVFVFAIFLGECRPAFVAHSGQDHKPAEADMEAARRALG